MRERFQVTMVHHRNYNFLLQCLATILLVLSAKTRCDQSSRIVFENGFYNEISIAFDNNVNATDCRDLINALNNTLFEASGYLSEVTQTPAAFGTIRVLIPNSWVTNCTGWTVAKVRDTYEAADIKISSSHPISSSLPWAEQQGGCGRTGNAIFIPPSFLTGDSFSAQERGRIFTHEWLKFRYGVFEEFGFLNDNFYLPCYKRNGSIYFTGCTNSVLPSLPEPISDSLNLSPEECQRLITDNLDVIKSQLASVSSSLMFSPLQLHPSDQIGGTCSNTTHNWYANTKQNVQCYRKSSSEVIKGHKDFQSIQSGVNGHVQNRKSTEKVNVVPKIELVTHYYNDIEQGYAFVIENSENIRKFNRLTHVKQSIVEFVELIDGKSKAPRGFTLTYDGQFHVIPGSDSLWTIDDSRKELFLATIPDPDKAAIRASFKNSAFETVNRTENKSLKIIFQTLKGYLDTTESYRKWNIIFITSQPPLELAETLELVKSTDYSVSVVTFDDSPEWLQWNSIPQTRKLLQLPVCFNEVDNVPCSAKTSSLFTDHFLEILSDQQPNRRVFQKIVELEIQGNETAKSFQVPRLTGSNDNFFFFLPVYSDSTTVSIISPNGQICPGQPLLNYPRLLVFRSTQSEPCAYLAGTWTLQVAPSNSAVSHILRGFVESIPQQDLVILPSFDDDLSKEIFCSTQNLFVPLHVIVKTVDDHPVVNAEVTAEIVYQENNTRIVRTVLALKDDGLDPDTTKDDGVYSTFIQGFSPIPSYHSGSISVITTDGSMSIEGISLQNKPMLFDSRMDEKCCGSYVPIDSSSTVSIGPTFYSMTLPSFKTGVAIPNPDDFPPSKIGIVNVLEETTELINLNFIAPGSNMNTGTVHHYDLCVFDDLTTEDLCQNIDTAECSPVPAGLEQNCKVYKSQLQSLISSEVSENKTVGDEIVIVCRLRGVNSANINGPLSSFLIEVRLTASSGLEECKSISDGCLPIEIFWILIGCLAGVLLILVVVSCCWFWMNRRGKGTGGDKKQKEPQRDNWETSNSHQNNNKKSNHGSVGKSLRSKEITHRPFDDEDDSREFYRTSFRNNNDMAEGMNAPKPLENNVRRRSISAGEINTKFKPTSDMTMHDSRVHLVDDHRDSDEMPVFFSNGTVGTPSRRAERPRNSQYYDSSFNQPRINYRQQQPQQQQLEHRDHHNSYNNNNNNLRNSQLNDTRNSGLDFIYPNQFNQKASSNGPFPLPSISSTIDLQMSNESLKSKEYHPVYASVNRNGRKSGTTTTIGADNHHNSGFHLPPHATVEYRNNNNNNNRTNTNANSNKTNSYLGPQSYNNNSNNNNNGPYKNQSRPQSSQSLDSGFVISHSQTLPPPPIRMDHFPSSESETYSEMSRGGPEPASSPPPPPPPMPTPGSTVASRSRPHSSVIVTGNMGGDSRGSQYHMMMMDDTNPPPPPGQPRPRSKTPPSTANGFGILAKMGPIPDRQTVLKKPRQGPPPPPPPRSSLKKPTDYDQPAYKQPVNSLMPNSFELRKINNNQIDSDRDNDNNNSDDDSDEWDVYDDFEFSPPGVSHV